MTKVNAFSKLCIFILDSVDSDILRVYIQKHGPVHPDVHGRILMGMDDGASGTTTLADTKKLCLILLCTILSLLKTFHS